MGNASRDAELRHTSIGKPVFGIRLATNRTVMGEEGTQYHKIVCRDYPAKTTAAYVSLESAERDYGVVFRYLGSPE